MIDSLLKLLIRKLVTIYYKRTKFLVYSWGIDEFTDMNIISEEYHRSYHRFGFRTDNYEVEEC